MKALSLWQPWAQAVALELKCYETRSWSTNYRDWLLVHAAKRWTEEEQAFWASSVRRLQSLGVDPSIAALYEAAPPLGCIVAVADLVGCRRTTSVYDRPEWVERLTGLERLFGDFSEGRWGWHFGRIVRLREPVPCKGAQGLWEPDAEVIRRVEAQLSCSPPSA